MNFGWSIIISIVRNSAMLLFSLLTYNFCGTSKLNSAFGLYKYFNIFMKFLPHSDQNRKDVWHKVIVCKNHLTRDKVEKASDQSKRVTLELNGRRRKRKICASVFLFLLSLCVVFASVCSCISMRNSKLFKVVSRLVFYAPCLR